MTHWRQHQPGSLSDCVCSDPADPPHSHSMSKKKNVHCAKIASLLDLHPHSIYTQHTHFYTRKKNVCYFASTILSFHYWFWLQKEIELMSSGIRWWWLPGPSSGFLLRVPSRFSLHQERKSENASTWSLLSLLLAEMPSLNYDSGLCQFRRLI